jgi:hypothetical protein
MPPPTRVETPVALVAALNSPTLVTIMLAAVGSPYNISETLRVNRSVTLVGEAPNVTFDGNNAIVVIEASGPVNVTLRGLHITRGRGSEAGAWGRKCCCRWLRDQSRVRG